MGVWFFIAGAAMGSFYNVLIDRLPNEQEIVKSRSQCTACHTTLRGKDLIPLVSFFMLKGRCRYCGAKLSWQYPASEFVVGSLFLLSYLLQIPMFDVAKNITVLALWSLIFIVGVMDFKYGIIIDQVLLAFAAVGIIGRLCAGTKVLELVLGAVSGFVFYGLIYLLARLFYKREAFGMGDVLLLAAIGVFLGPQETLLTGFLAFYCCVVALLIHRLAGKKLGRNAEMPFGPSICAAAFIVSLFGGPMLEFVYSWFYI